MTLRKISIEGFIPIKNDAPRGAAVQMKWIRIENLRVDPSYQRNISSGGKSNTRQIALRFSWRKFTPVVVCRAFEAEDTYIIIDGQHRTTAAALIGLQEVPCAIVLAPTIEEQADSFKSINGNITRITAQDLYFADLASGNEDAKNIDDLLKQTGVTIVKNRANGSSKDLKVGEALSVSVFKQIIRDFNTEVNLAAINCIVKTGEGNPGMLRPDIIKAICKILKANPRWIDHEKLLDAFNEIDLKLIFARASSVVTDYKTNRQTLIMQALHPLLTKKLGDGVIREVKNTNV